MSNSERAESLFFLHEQNKTDKELKDFKLISFTPELIEYSFNTGLLMTIRYTDNYSRILYNTIIN